MVGDGVTTREAQKRKRNSSADSAGTDSAREGRSPPDKCTNTVLLEICPRGNNKMVIIIFLVHDNRLLSMLELY